jgi:aryl-alcohol dehydrogenase-like predicted oxidoreductase
MKQVQLGDWSVSAIGYGCMGLSQAYEPCDEEDGIHTLNAVLDMGYTHLDTAAMYGFGANEQLLSRAVGHRRSEFFLASKCGLYRNAEGQRQINGRPEMLRQTCEDSLRRLKTDVIDLYYLHRKDPNVPTEDSVGTLMDLRDQGKIRFIGLSEVAPDTLRTALSMTPIAALQSEYSLWTRNPEGEILALCEAHQITLVAYSPVARGFLGGVVRDMSALGAKDIRHAMPRFQGDNFTQNMERFAALEAVSQDLGITPAQAGLAWLLAQSDSILPIPGTRFVARARENLEAASLSLPAEAIARIGDTIRPEVISGERYNETTLREIDSEKHRFIGA